ncbi:hemolysin family protein [Bradyrhizobium sp. ISRA443]|uniref:hemolysin family protein n=1 Tax=unclassified Bradyrhizobium TaxID=2631580 RepID=UPI002479BE4F|nr:MULTISPECIES: hemolysin family protein [unclassified Bradyrhizobium]WGS02531.1 hemolysin family protein [Bradyrhizobium sp. ISRA436]WGS09416.1 hemolysin family protein [Bradyrhizobium sp. ISRA437]WGS16305.1 hemolysin family protein [Bradyrhizobium sp. ISRA443]
MLYLELAVVTVLIVVNGLLSMSELAIVSSRPARLAALVEKGIGGSRLALALASDPGKFLSTVQIGITLIGVLSGAFSGATLGQRLTQWLLDVGLSPRIADAVGVGLVVGVITYASLIVGELVPKQIALRDPEAIAVKVAPAMTLMAKLSLPLVWLLDRSGKALLWVLGHREDPQDRVSEDEIKTLVVEAENAGVLEPGEKEMIAGVMRLGDLPVGAVMTPRHEVSLVDLSDPASDILAALQQSTHSRCVVFDGNRDHALGIVQAKEVLDVYLDGRSPDIRALTRDAPIIPETVDARDVVAILRDSAVHIGLVHDEYGTFQGVVTSFDILEAIVGAFHTEEGPAEPAFVRRGDGSYLISGWMPALEFAELLGIALPSPRPYQTAAGFLLHAFGAIPEVGARVAAQGWEFEVIDLDGRRIDKVLASRQRPA